MNDEDFFKEHPSLRGKLTYFLDKWFVNIELIDKTQIDQQKVKEVVDRLEEEGCQTGSGFSSYKLKKELGL